LFTTLALVSMFISSVGLIHPFTKCSANTFKMALKIIWKTGYPDALIIPVNAIDLALLYRWGLIVAIPLIYYSFYRTLKIFLSSSVGNKLC
jgi:hypothetical protein